MRLTRRSTPFQPAAAPPRPGSSARPSRSRSDLKVWQVWNPDAVGRLVRVSALSVGGLITPIGLLIVTIMSVGR